MSLKDFENKMVAIIFTVNAPLSFMYFLLYDNKDMLDVINVMEREFPEQSSMPNSRYSFCQISWYTITYHFYQLTFGGRSSELTGGLFAMLTSYIIIIFPTLDYSKPLRYFSSLMEFLSS